MKSRFTIILIFISAYCFAQPSVNMVYNGNKAFKDGDFPTAIHYYQLAIEKDNNPIAKFNLANALLKEKKIEPALRYFMELSATAKETEIKAKAFYNKGVIEVKQKQLQEGIESFKKSLVLNPNDKDAKENLQKAINELKNQQKSRSEESKKSQPKPQYTKNKKDPARQLMEQKFNELRNKERQLQKMLQQKPGLKQREKDW